MKAKHWYYTRRKMKKRIKLIAKIIAIIVVIIIPLRVFVGEPCQVPSSSMENTIHVADWLWINKITYGACLPRRWADIPLINAFTWIRWLREADEQRDWGDNRFPGFLKPKHPDLVVFRSPENERLLLIKRLVGIPGEEIEICDGWLKVNKHLIILPPTLLATESGKSVSLADFPPKTIWTIHNYGPIKVPGKHVSIILSDENYPYLKNIIEKEGNSIYKRNNTFCINGRAAISYQFKYDYYFVLGDNRSNSRDSRFFGFVAEHAIIGKVNHVLFSAQLHRLFKSLE